VGHRRTGLPRGLAASAACAPPARHARRQRGMRATSAACATARQALRRFSLERPASAEVALCPWVRHTSSNTVPCRQPHTVDGQHEMLGSQSWLAPWGPSMRWPISQNGRASRSENTCCLGVHARQSGRRLQHSSPADGRDRGRARHRNPRCKRPNIALFNS